MKTIKKCLSLFLALLTLFSICSASTTVFAAEYTEQNAREEYFDSALSGYLKNIVDTEDAVSISEKEQVDEVIEEANSSVSRTASTFSLRAASVQSTENVKETVEELDIDHTRLTLELEDGENVAYLFSEPVSFIDDEGNLVYKDTNIKAVTDSAILNRGYSYENGNNDYKAYFSKDSSKGLLLVEKNGEEIRIIPNGTTSVGTVKQIESDMELVDSFEYAGVYGTDTVLRFLPQLNGCKEEIVLSSYQGVSDFSFSLYTEEGTIAAINSKGEVEIINSESKEIITTFVAPFANDSSGGLDVTSEHYTDCTYELETISEGKYTLTISVPEEYLESESTVYPVIIDPTTSNISMELDTAVYSSRSDSPQGANPSACFGKTGTSEYGKGRALYYFPLPSDIKKYAKISSAKLWLREVTGRDTTMYVRPYFVTESWNNSTTWNTQPAYSTTFSYLGTSGVSLARRNINSTSTDHATVPYWYAFNITNAVRAWSTGTSNKGVMFIAECEAADGDYLWRGFATKEHTTSAFRPYAVITYTNDTTKPVISKVTASTSAWTNENVTLTVTASDNVYGIYRYSFIDGDGWRKTNNKTFSENGTIQIRVKDYAGNISNRYTYVIDNIDKTAPTISKVALSSTSWTNSSVKVTVTASDSASGLAAKAYSFDNGSTWQANNYKSYSSNSSTINIKVRDALGNIATYSSNPVKISNIDKTAPTASASADVTSASVKITVTATDALSGLNSTAYSFDGGAWQSSNVYLNDSAEAVTIKVRDKANNIKEFTYTPPAIDNITVTPSVANDVWANENVVLTVNGSGIVKYKFGDNDWQTENYFEFAENGEVVILVEDENGYVANAPTYNITNIDKVNPDAPIVYEQDGTLYISAPSLNETDGTSETIMYQIGGNDENNYTAVDGDSLELDIVRTYDVPVYAYIVDEAGNIGDVISYTIENTLGEYTASYTDIALGEGLFPVEFGRTYTSTNGWFFTFDANVVKIDDNSYVFTDFYGEKQYFIKNGKGNYLSIDEEELTVNADSYVLAYGEMTCTFGLDGKINRITTDYLDTTYTWTDNGTLTITGGATVTFDTDGNPTNITITRTDSDGTAHTKEVEYVWTEGNLTKFIDAADFEHNYAYTNGLLTTNETETITYSAEGRVKLISQSNGAFVKYTYDDNAENAEAPNNVGAVTVSDSKGVTDTIYYADGVYISNTLGSYSDNAVYAPESISNALTQDSLADVVYVVEEPQEDESADGTDVETGETETEEPEDTENEPEYTYDENGNVLTETYSSTVDGQNVIVDQYIYTYTEDNKLTTEKYYAADESNALCLVSEYVYDANENIISELYYTQETIDEEKVDVISECYTREYSGENMTSEIYKKRVDGELVNQEKTVYSYDDKGNVANESVCQWLANAWYQIYCEEYIYDNYGNALSQTTSEYKNAVNAETGLVETTSDIVTATYEYDVWNQQVKVTESINATENTITTVVYDALGRVVSVAEDDELTAYTYDSKDNILTVTEDEEVTTYTYSDNGNLVSRTNPNGTVASYVYDSYGNLTNHAFNGYAFTYNTLGSILTANSESGQLVNYTYSSTVEQDVINADFGNGQSIVYDYNEDGEIIAIKLDEETKYGYEYLETTDDNGEVTKEWTELTDYVSGIKKVIEESKLTVNDLNGNFIYSVENASKDEEVEDSFDGTVTTIGSDVYTLVAEENKDTFKTNGTTDFTKEYTYVNDELSKTYTAGITTSYSYNADNLISILENTLNDVSQVYGYAYDENGNITTETLATTSKDENGATVETNEAIHYTYDDKEQLISAETSSIKYEYTYDDRGNILTKKEYSISFDENNEKVYTLVENGTDTYAYDETWKDKLISYNGQTITYDAVGNPTNYMGNTLTWTMGRQLATFGDISYTYNEDGIRTSKTSNGVTTKVYLDGTNVIEQTDGTTTLHFFYDSNGEVIGFRYNGNDYFYVKNAMSDIIAVTDSNKNIVAEYRYDPWGYVLSISGDTVIGELNPFRYRSYYYDNDIEMYCLQSRYYDAEVGRFINCDDVNYIGITESEISYNPFAYCENNTINDVDYSGNAVNTTRLYTIVKSAYSGKYGFLGLGFHNPNANTFTDFFDKTWSTKKWCIQRNLGYCDLYDNAAWAMGCFIHCLKSEFRYKNKWWRIELWMGRYGISVGGEIGFYNSNSKNKPKIFNCVKTSEEQKMNFTLYEYDSLSTLLFNSKSMNSLFSISTNIYEDNKHWWLTGFLYNLNLTKHPPYSKNLFMSADIVFDNKEMANKFAENLNCTGLTKTAFKVKVVKSNKKYKVTIQWTSRYNKL